ncbi:MAG: GNAT family N-acetyltransferase [Acidobacteriaceae bacterium]
MRKLTNERDLPVSEAVEKIEVRKIVSIPEMEACVQLQQSVWQFRDLDIVPRRMFAVANAVGGQVLGAWDGERLVGYALAIPGLREGQPYFHSHMLAVAPEYRNHGIGRMLKIAQREDALARGIELIEWTFDPLEIKNAFFNIEKLGAIVRRYTPDFYGASTSPLHGNLPTDRLHAEWWLNSERVRSLIAGDGLPNAPINETITVTDTHAGSSGTLHPLPTLALESLLKLRREFSAAFSTGLTVLRFQKLSGDSAFYQLGHWNEKHQDGQRNRQAKGSQ